MSSNGRTADSGSVNGGSTPSIPAIMARSSSGLGRRPLKAEITSSNLVRATKNVSPDRPVRSGFCLARDAADYLSVRAHPELKRPGAFFSKFFQICTTLGTPHGLAGSFWAATRANRNRNPGVFLPRFKPRAAYAHRNTTQSRISEITCQNVGNATQKQVPTSRPPARIQPRHQKGRHRSTR